MTGRRRRQQRAACSGEKRSGLEACRKKRRRKEEASRKEVHTDRPFAFWKRKQGGAPKECQTIYLDSTEPVTHSPQPIRQALGDTALRRSDKVETRLGRDGTSPLRSSNIDPCCPVLREFEDGRKPRKQEDDDPNLIIIGPPLYRNPSRHRKLRRQIDTTSGKQSFICYTVKTVPRHPI